MRRRDRFWLLRLLAVLILSLAVLRIGPARWDGADSPELKSAYCQDGETGKASIRLTGARLDRINRLWLNGRPVRARFERVYSTEYRVYPELSALPEEDCRVSVGKAYAVTLGAAFRSNEVTLPGKASRKE